MRIREPQEILDELERQAEPDFRRTQDAVLRAIYKSALLQAELMIALSRPPMTVSGDLPADFKPEPGSITYVKG